MSTISHSGKWTRKDKIAEVIVAVALYWGQKGRMC